MIDPNIFTCMKWRLISWISARIRSNSAFFISRIWIFRIWWDSSRIRMTRIKFRRLTTTNYLKILNIFSFNLDCFIIFWYFLTGNSVKGCIGSRTFYLCFNIMIAYSGKLCNICWRRKITRICIVITTFALLKILAH